MVGLEYLRSLRIHHINTPSAWTHTAAVHCPWAHDTVIVLASFDALSFWGSLHHSVSSSEDLLWIPPRIWGSFFTFP